MESSAASRTSPPDWKIIQRPESVINYPSGTYVEFTNLEGIVAGWIRVEEVTSETKLSDRKIKFEEQGRRYHASSSAYASVCALTDKEVEQVFSKHGDPHATMQQVVVQRMLSIVKEYLTYKTAMRRMDCDDLYSLNACFQAARVMLFNRKFLEQYGKMYFVDPRLNKLIMKLKITKEKEILGYLPHCVFTGRIKVVKAAIDVLNKKGVVVEKPRKDLPGAHYVEWVSEINFLNALMAARINGWNLEGLYLPNRLIHGSAKDKPDQRPSSRITGDYIPTLSVFLRTNPSLADRIKIIFQLVKGIYTLHTIFKTAHHDLTLENVLCDGEAKIFDYGCVVSLLSRRSCSLGTFGYAPPEILKKPTSTHHAAWDAWCLGVLIIEVMTGLPPLVKTLQGDIETFDQGVFFRHLHTLENSSYLSIMTLAGIAKQLLREDPLDRMGIEQCFSYISRIFHSESYEAMVGDFSIFFKTNSSVEQENVR
jgi:hypothetical protein